MNSKLLLLLLATSGAFGGVTGDWQGILEFPAGKLHFILHLTGADDSLSATAQSPDQGIQILPVNAPIFKDDFLTFSIPALGVVFGGELDDERIRGVFSQNGIDVPVILTLIPKPPSQSVARVAAGSWSGVLNTPRGSLRLVVHFTENGASADSPDESIIGMPIDSVSVEGDNISFQFRRVFAFFQGTISPRAIRGTFHQDGYGLSLVLKPAAEPTKP
jgi:hypothetical protein